MRQTVPAAPTSSALWDKRADYSKAHFDAKSKREGETSDWILAEREYELWVRSDRADNVLRCEGRPGSGKTVIAFVALLLCIGLQQVKIALGADDGKLTNLALRQICGHRRLGNAVREHK